MASRWWFITERTLILHPLISNKQAKTIKAGTARGCILLRTIIGLLPKIRQLGMAATRILCRYFCGLKTLLMALPERNKEVIWWALPLIVGAMASSLGTMAGMNRSIKSPN